MERERTMQVLSTHATSNVLVIALLSIFIALGCFGTCYYFWKKYQLRIQRQIDEEEGAYMDNLQELHRVTIVPIRPRLNVSVLTQQPSFYSAQEEFMPPWNTKTNEQQMIWSAPFSPDNEDNFTANPYFYERHITSNRSDRRNNNYHHPFNYDEQKVSPSLQVGSTKGTDDVILRCDSNISNNSEDGLLPRPSSDSQYSISSDDSLVENRQLSIHRISEKDLEFTPSVTMYDTGSSNKRTI